MDTMRSGLVKINSVILDLVWYNSRVFVTS